MSADRYSQCPNCSKEHYAQVNEMEKELENSYGKVDLNEWMKKKKELEKFNKEFENEDETLREDWQLYFDEVGYLVVKYGCGCDVCGFHYSFEEIRNIMEKQD